MNRRILVDVGNSRIKWGLFGERGVEAIAALPPSNPDAWEKQLSAWGLNKIERWTLAGVQPKFRDELASWLRERGEKVALVVKPEELPLRIRLEHPDKVGIDRLLNAVAVVHQVRPNLPAVIIDAGSAVTVDWVNADGEFAGGSIFPGLRLMARSLHDYTALLPEVEIKLPLPKLPGLSTIAAMQLGIYWAVAGGIEATIKHLRQESSAAPSVYLTGGDSHLFAGMFNERHWPEMTLEGLRIATDSVA
jgi:type III pantothenate kinase